MTGNETLAEELRIALAKLKAVEALTVTWLQNPPGWSNARGMDYVAGFEDGWAHAADLLRHALEGP